MSSPFARLADVRLPAGNDPLYQEHSKCFLSLVSGPDVREAGAASLARAGLRSPEVFDPRDTHGQLSKDLRGKIFQKSGSWM